MPHTCPAYVAHTEPSERVFNVMDYGAVHDGVVLKGHGTIAASSTAFSCSNATFTDDDVGKLILVAGANAGDSPFYVTTIAARVSATEVTLAAPAAISVTTAEVAYGTDDQPAIQAAADACAAAGGGEVYIPAGTYLAYEGISVDVSTSGNIALLDGVHLRGAGTGSTILHGIMKSHSVVVASQTTNIGVSDMHITATPTDMNAVKFDCCDYATIDNVVSHVRYEGLTLYSCHDSVISNSAVYDAQRSFEVAESYVKFQANDNVLVSDCVAHTTIGGSSRGFIACGVLPGEPVYPDSDGVRLDGVTLVNCAATGFTLGFDIFYANNINLTNCTADSSYGDLWRIFMTNVNTAQLHNCTPAGLVTTVNDHGYWVQKGSQDCVGVVED